MKKLALSGNALQVLAARYLLKDLADQKGSKGERHTETPEAWIIRVAKAVAAAEPASKRKAWEKKFHEKLSELKFLPNSPTLMNAGKPKGQLSACFVLPVEDSLDGIFETLKDAAQIHQSGGGTGFSFSRLRPEGSPVHTSQGVASGPLSFMKIFDTATETIKQGGTRRGANMAILRVDHPDIDAFIGSKRGEKVLTNFNISVGATDAFFEAVRSKGKITVIDPRTGKSSGMRDATALFDSLVDAAWECGDPGIVFLDRMNRFNPTPQVGEFESTNPCGEQPLLPYESCNLGSINLAAYVSTGQFQWAEFVSDISIYVRFLDNVIEVNAFPIPESAQITRKNRKIGLGVMGLADAFLKLGIAYDSEEALVFGERVMSVLDREAKRASMALARERGAFPNFKGSLWERLGYPKLRNATVSTIAPTGTISIIAGCSSGIEPLFSAFFYRNVLSGARLPDFHPLVREKILERGESEAQWLSRFEKGQVTDHDLNELFGGVFRTASEVSVESHVRMQAVFQRHSDSSVSKTINLPQSATREDVKKAYLLAYELGCKGITIYRDQSRATQVLEKPKTAPSSDTGTSTADGSFCPEC